MGKVLVVLLSFLLVSPDFLLAYNDYSSYERGPDSYSFNNSQETWKRNFNFRESFNYNAPLTRAPIQFPKVSLDLTFQNTFRSFSSFNAPNFARKLDLNYKSFASSSFPVKPVVQNYNFKLPASYSRNVTTQVPHPSLRGPSDPGPLRPVATACHWQARPFPQEGKENKDFPSPLGRPLTEIGAPGAAEPLNRGQGEGPELLP